MRIEEVQSTTKKQRVATHTHIKGLGLRVRAGRLPVLAERASEPPLLLQCLEER